MRVKLLFFATLRDQAGIRSTDMEIPTDTTVQRLKERISRDYPKLNKSMKTVLVSINHEYAFDDARIPLDAEIALFPPVSGG
jgi:molybdopterin converting factor subunit 1